MKRVLVTGGAGFVGSHLCDRLIKEPFDARVDRIYNLACPASLPFYQKDMVDTAKVLKFTDSKSRLIHCPLPSDDPTKRRPDISLAKEKLNWQPGIKLDEGLVKTIAYFKNVIQ